MYISIWPAINTKLIRKPGLAKVCNLRRANIKWKPHVERFQKMYDTNRRLRVLRKLWRCATTVRSVMSNFGSDQTALASGHSLSWCLE